MALSIIGLITLVLTIAWGIIKYVNSDKTKIAKLKARQYELQDLLRAALARKDTVAISSLSIELELVRQKLRDLDPK